MQANKNKPLNLSDESTEMLLLTAVFGHESVRKAAVGELKRRRALSCDSEDDNLFTTNLSSVC